jgi:hypothetical protein
MTRATKTLSLTPSAVRCLGEATGRLSRRHQLTRAVSLTIGSALLPSIALWGLALVELLVGPLVLTLQGAPVAWSPPKGPSLVACAAASLPCALDRGSEACPSLNCPEESDPAIMARRGPPPHDNLTPEDGDLDDDDSLSIVVLTRGDLPLSLIPIFLGINGPKHAFPWASRYLVRPQRLTRLSPSLRGGLFHCTCPKTGNRIVHRGCSRLHARVAPGSPDAASLEGNTWRHCSRMRRCGPCSRPRDGDETV